MALVAAGLFLAVATVLHPSRETAATIIASEPRLVAAHVLLDSITQYPPALAVNALAAIAFMVGFALFGIALTRTSLPPLSGLLVAVGGPAHLLGFGMAQLVSVALWPVAVLGAVSLGAGLALPGVRLGRASAA